MSLQQMTASSFEQFFVLKKNSVFDYYVFITYGHESIEHDHLNKLSTEFGENWPSGFR